MVSTYASPCSTYIEGLPKRLASSGWKLTREVKVTVAGKLTLSGAVIYALPLDTNHCKLHSFQRLFVISLVVWTEFCLGWVKFLRPNQGVAKLLVLFTPEKNVGMVCEKLLPLHYGLAIGH